jgi:2-oxoglutarate/2-oxoacid ferredoxin oxidoreductase subunit beta
MPLDEFTDNTPTWCPGCGDWGINAAVKKSFAALHYHPSSVAIAFGIGCSGNMNDFLNSYAFHGLHGRAIPTATGIKLANHSMPVVVVAGDGDTYGEGGNHFLHACRGNHDITLIVHDNGVYGLTTGQVAPTAATGSKGKSTPTGLIERPVSPLALAITQGATFVAQTFAGDLTHMVDIMTQGLSHRGFSLINVLQPCVTFNKVNTYLYYHEKSYKLPADYDSTNFNGALEKALEMDHEKFPLGVIYNNDRPVYHTQLPAYDAQVPLLKKPRFTQFEALLTEFE